MPANPNKRRTTMSELLQEFVDSGSHRLRVDRERASFAA